MLFDDVFYPDNPKRRQEALSLRIEITNAFLDYKEQWNKWASLLNAAFSSCAEEPYKSFRITTLSKDITKDTIKDCLDEITNAAETTNPTMEKLVEAMGITQFLPPDWDKEGIKVADLDRSIWTQIGKYISLTGSTVLAGFAGFYIFRGVAVVTMLISAVTGTSSALSTLCAGALGGVVFAAVFVITDMISSAITGAIERKELNEALDSLRELKEKVADPLHKSAISIEAVCTDIKNKNYTLGNGYILHGNEDGSYSLMKLVPVSANDMLTATPKAMENEDFVWIPAQIAV